MHGLIARAHRSLLLLNGSLAGLAMILIFLLVTANAVGRYTLGKSILWGEDTAVYLLIYGLMFGMAWAYLQDRHIGFDLLRRLLPRPWQPWQALATDLMVVIIGAGLTLSAWEFIAARGGRTSSSTGLPMWVFQSSILLGGILLIFSGLVMAARRIERTGSEAS